MNEFKIIEHMSYDLMIVMYFFLGGLGAGSYFFSVAANYWKKEFKPLAKTAALITPAVLAVGIMLLVVDLGQSFRMWRLFLHFDPHSALSWGVWFFAFFFAVSVFYAWFVIIGKENKIKKIAYFGCSLAVLFGSYTAVILIQAPGRVLWHSPLNPMLFLLGGLISGIALILLLSAGRQDISLLRKVGKLLGFLVLMEMILILVEMLSFLNGDAASVRIVKMLTVGNYSLSFWGGQIVLGAIIPMFILLRNKVSAPAHALASILILAGIFTMRYIIIIGGQVPTF